MSREGLLGIIASMVAGQKFITIIRHDGMKARGQDDEHSSKSFLISNCVKRGCALATTVFSLMSSAMLTDMSRLLTLELA